MSTESTDSQLPTDGEPVAPQPTFDERALAAKAQMRKQQDIFFALIGGLSSAIAGAVVWAAITVVTNYQIGYMAVGVGLLVGFGVRFFGAGVDTTYSVIGAVFALLGCALGNLLSQIHFIAVAESLSYFDVISLLSPSLISTLFAETFSPMDVLFYGLAAWEGFKFAVRPVTDEILADTAGGRLTPLPYAKLRGPAVIGLYMVLAAGGFALSRGSSGVKTFHHESGGKSASGEMNHGERNGFWSFWYENGNLQMTGSFKDNVPDSLWTYYNEEGVLVNTAMFRDGMVHGPKVMYFANGKVSSTETYHYDRKHGMTDSYYEDGTPSMKGFYKLDNQDSVWETYFDNGKLATKGAYKDDEKTGVWTEWNDRGIKTVECEYTDNLHYRTLNTWDSTGKPVIVAGEGKYTSYHANNQVHETGLVSQGQRTGRWKVFGYNGRLYKELDYKAGKQYVVNSWSYDGKPLVVNGEGDDESYYFSDSALMIAGPVHLGLPTGKWENFAFGTKARVGEMTYVEGILSGPTAAYFEGGQLNMEGSLKNGRRDGTWKWYHENGNLETSISYVNGVKEGEQRFLDEDGKPKRTEIYQAGKLVETRIDME